MCVFVFVFLLIEIFSHFIFFEKVLRVSNPFKRYENEVKMCRKMDFQFLSTFFLYFPFLGFFFFFD
jgi:regulatory protein YycI of two-component signal transduction system YycFG